MTQDLNDICRKLDRMAKKGDPFERELAVHLTHEISDWLGRSDKPRVGSIKVSQDTPSATST